MNPEQGYLASANQIAAEPEYDYGTYWLQNEYANGYRVRRINELLNTTDNFTVERMKEIQLDINSSTAKAFIPTLLNVIEYSYGANIPEKIVPTYSLLKEWRYMMDKTEAAPTIYRKWRDFFYDFTFNDDIDHYNLTGDPQLVRLEYLMNNGSSHWFNNISTGTPDPMTRNHTMLLALNKTIDWLADVYGTDSPSKWIWGSLHKVKFSHLTGLDVLSVGPIPESGEAFTVNPAGAHIDEDGGVAYGGASERLIVDFNDLGNSISCIPSGESGHPHLNHYTDQLYGLFLQGKYHSTYYDYIAANFPSIESRITFKSAGGEA